MIILKQVIHYPDNTVEATWVDQTSPAITTPESVAPDTTDEEGNVIPGVVTPASTTPAVEVQIKCHSYADVQMDMFRADAAALGTPLDDYEDMIADIESKIVPYVPPPPVVPQVISMRQARLALHSAGLLTMVEAAIDAQAEPFKTQAMIEWDYATEVARTWPTLMLLAPVLGLTEAQLDALFIQASQL